MRFAIRIGLVVSIAGLPGLAFPQPGVAPASVPQPAAVQPPAPAGAGHSHAGPAQPRSGPAGGEAPAAPQPPAAAALPSFIPPITEADRKAAFPDVQGHAVHDQALHAYVLFDRLEWQTGNGSSGAALDSRGWIGTDTSRFWFRAEGKGDGQQVEEAQVDLLYGRAISRWWGLVAGARQDFRPGGAQAWGAIGIQGLAPYWFEVGATAYIGADGRTQFRAKTEYDLLVTNRLIVQPLFEIELSGKSDPARGIGAGLSSADFGLRVRYELRRELAPYAGVTWDRKFLGTADYAAAAGEPIGGARLVVGLRLWR